jgi:hypothetical protein
MFALLPDTPRVSGSAGRKRCERIKDRSSDDEQAADTLSGELPRGDELPDTVLRDPERLRCFARADQIARFGHPAR